MLLTRGRQHQLAVYFSSEGGGGEEDNSTYTGSRDSPCNPHKVGAPMLLLRLRLREAKELI